MPTGGNNKTKVTDNNERARQIKSSSYSYRQRPESADKAMRMRKEKKGSRSIVVALLCAVLVFALLTVTVHIFFRVEKITVEGNYHYSADEIISRSGISVGMNMYSIKKNVVKDTILEKVSGIADVKIDRTLPSSVKITVVEHVPAMYIAVGDSYYVLSSSMLVLKPETDASYIEENGLIRIYTPDVTGAISGQRLETADEDVANLVAELYASLCELDMQDAVTEINMRDKFSISLNYAGKYTIKLGNALKLHEKLSAAKQIMEKAEQKYGIIDVSDDDVEKAIHTWG